MCKASLLQYHCENITWLLDTLSLLCRQICCVWWYTLTGVKDSNDILTCLLLHPLRPLLYGLRFTSCKSNPVSAVLSSDLSSGGALPPLLGTATFTDPTLTYHAHKGVLPKPPICQDSKWSHVVQFSIIVAHSICLLWSMNLSSSIDCALCPKLQIVDHSLVVWD